jgi:hypothetical protein
MFPPLMLPHLAPNFPQQFVRRPKRTLTALLADRGLQGFEFFPTARHDHDALPEFHLAEVTDALQGHTNVVLA